MKGKEDNRTGTIYGVFSGDDSRCRYVGATIRKLAYREREHVRAVEKGSQTPVARFIRKRGEVTLVPIITGVPRDEIGVYEKAVIQLYQSIGDADLNLVQGGYRSDDYFEYRKTPEQRKRQSDISKENWSNPEWASRQRSKIAASLKTDEYRKGARERVLRRIEEGTFTPGSREGSKNHRAKLDEESVLAIREGYAQGGVFYRELAVQYNVTEACIHRIVKRKSWTHV